jgi:hypothetical protein
MPINGRGNTIIFGKITLSSEIESMDSIVKQLSNVIKSHGYPEQDPAKNQDVREAEKKLKEMMSSESEDSQALFAGQR